MVAAMFDPRKANQPLIDAIAEFCGRHGLSRSRFGELALNDPAFVGQLENGRMPNARTQFRLNEFMTQYESDMGIHAKAGAA